MSQSTSYKVLSQAELRDEAESEQISLTETSDEQTSSQDSLDLVLLEIGNKRKLRRKRRRHVMGMSSFDGAESYEVSEPKPMTICPIVMELNRFVVCSSCHVS